MIGRGRVAASRDVGATTLGQYRSLRMTMKPSSDVRLRPMARADVPAVARLATEFAQHMRALGDTTPLRLDAAALERDGFGSRPAFAGIVAVRGDEVLGYLLHHDGYDTDAACRVLFVCDLFVHHAARGHGVGAALMRDAAAIATARGATQLVWTVATTNILARQFYERLGARVADSVNLMYITV